MPRLPARTLLSIGTLAVAVGVLLSAGCGPKQRPYAAVKGKVTYKGKPVSAGSVYFVLVEDSQFTGGDLLNADGEFTGTAPVGKVKLAIQTASLKPGASGPPGGGTSRPPGSGGPGGSSRPPGSGGPPPPGGGGPGGPSGGPPPGSMDYAAKTGQGGEGDPKAKVGKYTPIPDKYETIETTDLEFEIKPGENDLGTIELKGELKK